MQECEKRRQLYLFRQGQTKRDKELIQLLECKGGWGPLADGWEGCEGASCLMDWTRKRRIVVLRCLHESAGPLAPLPLLGDGAAKLVCESQYENQVRVTNLSECLSVTTQL